MESIYNILIAKLKMQPKHGMPADPNKVNDNLSPDYWKNLTAATQQYSDSLDAFKATLPSFNKLMADMGAVLGGAASESAKLSEGFQRARAYQDEYNKQVKSLIQGVTGLEQSSAELNKEIGISSARSLDFARDLREMNKTIRVSDKTLFAAAASISKFTAGYNAATGVHKGFNEKLEQGQIYLTENMQLSDEAAEGVQLFAAGIGTSAVEYAANLQEASKLLGAATGMDAAKAQREILSEIGNTAADVQMQYSRIPGSLELGALKARALGTSLEKLNTTGQSLLNIESSIGAELEYQQLTGQRLLTRQGKSLTNEYRMATIQGDAAKQADLMNQFIKDQGDELENNLFARKKAAELMGTDEATLAKMIQKQKMLKKLGAEEILKLNKGDMAATIKQLRAENAPEEDIEALLKASDTRTTAERDTQALEAIQSDIALIARGGKDSETFLKETRKSTEASMEFAKKMSETFGSKAVIQGLGGLGMLQERMQLIATPFQQVADILPAYGQDIKAGLDKVTKWPWLKGRWGDKDITLEPKNAAAGGTMSAGDISLVGEQGPELVQFSRNAYVTPTNQTKSALNAPAIDYSKLATAVASAMKNINVTANVRTDDFMSATHLNGRKRI
jgi:hypothetical protein